MSTNNEGKTKGKLIGLGLLVILFASLMAALRQAGVYYSSQKKLAQEEKELQGLQEKNRALQVRLEEVKKPEFLDEESRKLLGLGDSQRGSLILPTSPLSGGTSAFREEPKPPNYQKWWRLFFF